MDAALGAVGELLAADGRSVALVIVGGACLNMLGALTRTTADIDVIAQVHFSKAGDLDARTPIPFPAELVKAIATVARDFRLAPDWMNNVVGSQFRMGLPPTLFSELTWKDFGGLRIGLPARSALLALKLFAAVDRGPRSVHMQDLLALRPTSLELKDAAT